jgi:NAD(P)-dependent dehydrogenase (short-subunit alcohol dehydrogenase family)
VAIGTGGGRGIGRGIRKKSGAEGAALHLVADQSRTATVQTPNVDGATTFD